MAYGAHPWESFTDIPIPSQLGSTDPVPFGHSPETPDSRPTIPLHAAPILRETIVLPHAVSGRHEGSSRQVQPQIDWAEITRRTTIDASQIHVSTSDATKITADRHTTQPQRAALVAHDAMVKFAEVAEVDASLVDRASTLAAAYFDTAAYIYGHQKKSVEVQVINELLDEQLAPILHATPIPVAERYLKALHYRTEGYLGVIMTKLWAADTYSIELPSSYQAIRKIKHIPKEARWPSERY